MRASSTASAHVAAGSQPRHAAQVRSVAAPETAALERRRNPTSLRRIDWRFLLPGSAPYESLYLIGGGDAIAELLATAGVARAVYRSRKRAGAAQCVVVLADGRARPREVAMELAAGGMVWWEVDRALHPGTTPARLSRELRLAGLLPITTYAVRGPHDRSTMYLPIDNPGAVEWYSESFFRATGRSRRIARAALRRLTGWRASRLSPLLPRFAIVAVRPSEQHLPPELLDTADLPPGIVELRAKPVLLKSGEGEWSRIVLLPFSPNGRRPSVVLKIPRAPAYEQATLGERQALLRLRSMLNPSLTATIPEPLGAGVWKGAPVTVEGFLDGESLRGSDAGGMERRRAVEELREGARWVTEFHRQTRTGDLNGGELLDSVFRPTLSRFLEAFGTNEPRAELMVAVQDRLREVRGSISLAWQHRDFGPWNLRRRIDGGIAVLDWEVARPGPCLTDLLYFAMFWLWLARHRATDSGRTRDLTALFCRSNPTLVLEASARTEIERYLAALEIDPGMLPLLLVQTLMDQALDRRDRLAAREREGDAGDENIFVGCLDHLGLEAGELVSRW